MRFDIWTETLPEAYHWDPTNPVSGTNKFYVRLAEGLASRGHSVVVRYDGKPLFSHRGVVYAGRDGAREGILIDCNEVTPEGDLHWTSKYGQSDFLVSDYKHIFLLSNFHASTIIRSTELPSNVSILPLACDFACLGDVDLLKRPRRCCYTSSPDRGGIWLSNRWAEIERETGYELILSDYRSTDIASLLQSSRFWLHPALGVELFCTSAIEAQASGCIPFYVPHMALPETCRYGIKTDVFKFKDDLIRTLKKADETLAEFSAARAVALEANPLPTWNEIVDRVEEVCLKIS